MKVKDWLSVINVDDSDWFEVKILDDDYYCLKTFEHDELEKLIKRYGENQIKDANIIVSGITTTIIILRLNFVLTLNTSRSKRVCLNSV